MAHKIKTTINPDREIEVEDDEYLDLKRMGLISWEESSEKPEPAETETETVTETASTKGTKRNA